MAGLAREKNYRLTCFADRENLFKRQEIHGLSVTCFSSSAAMIIAAPWRQSTGHAFSTAGPVVEAEVDRHACRLPSFSSFQAWQPAQSSSNSARSRGRLRAIHANLAEGLGKLAVVLCAGHLCHRVRRGRLGQRWRQACQNDKCR